MTIQTYKEYGTIIFSVIVSAVYGIFIAYREVNGDGMLSSIAVISFHLGFCFSLGFFIALGVSYNFFFSKTKNIQDYKFRFLYPIKNWIWWPRMLCGGFGLMGAAVLYADEHENVDRAFTEYFSDVAFYIQIFSGFSFYYVSFFLLEIFLVLLWRSLRRFMVKRF